jgi:8-oxo-dGTP pyrophosphatase MutT (NUDIX family)
MYCLELPAGLCDTDEAPEVTAVREMKEETGYTAQVVDVSPSLIVRSPSLPVNVQESRVTTIIGCVRGWD